MSDRSPEAATATPPWEAKRKSKPRHLVRKTVTWIVAIAVVAAIGWSLRPQPIEVELGTVARGALTVHVVEEGKTRIRNRYVVAAPVAGQMKRVPLKPGDPVKAGETVLTTMGATNTKSHAPSTAQPPAIAAPCTAATTTCGSRRRDRFTALRRRMNSASTA
jgi:hypothetical protein